MESGRAHGLDRYTQEELGEALRERYGDPGRLPRDLERLLDALRGRADPEDAEARAES